MCNSLWCVVAGCTLLAPVQGHAVEAPAWCTVAPSQAPREEVAAAVKVAQSRINDAPNAMAVLHTSGQLPGAPGLAEAQDADHDLGTMRNAAVAWYAGAGDQYLEMAKRYLMAWVDVYRPIFKPIDEMHFIDLIETYAIVRDRLDPASQAKVELLLHNWGNGYLAEMAAHPEDREKETDKWNNNFQSFRVELVTLMAVALGDRTMFDKAKKLFWEHLSINMKPDGSVIDFYQRDALHYVHHDLEPLLEAALAAQAYGEDWYHAPASNGASLEKGVRWLVPYATGEKTHQEFVHSQVPFDAQRAAAGVEGMSGQFDPKKAVNTFWLASKFDPSYRQLAESLGKEQPFLGICGK